MELNKSKSILNQKQEDLLTGIWTAVEDTLLRKTARSPRSVLLWDTRACPDCNALAIRNLGWLDGGLVFDIYRTP